MVSALSQRVDQLGERVDQLEEQQITGQERTDKSEEVSTLLPVGDMNDFDLFEKRLTEDETFRKSFVSII